MEATMKICVLVDFTDERGADAGRHNFWREVQETYSEHDWQYVSLEELRRQHVVFNFDEFDMVILGNDVANGDYVFHSHIPWLYLHLHGRIRQESWFRTKQARFLVEHQGIRLVPVQAIYDSILGPKQVTVSEGEPSYTELAGSECVRVKRFCDHPLLQFMERPEDFNSAQRGMGSAAFFGSPTPSWRGLEGKRTSVYDKEPESLYGGWFQNWGKDWVPLLQAADGKAPSNHAILLIRVLDRPPYPSFGLRRPKQGIVIATTMRLAASASKPLLDGLINVDFNAVLEYHRKIRRYRTRNTVVLAAITIASLLITSAVLLFGWQYVIPSAIAPSPWEVLRSAVGLPLVGLWYTHLRLYKSFANRSYQAQSLWETVLSYCRHIYKCWEER